MFPIRLESVCALKQVMPVSGNYICTEVCPLNLIFLLKIIKKCLKIIVNGKIKCIKILQNFVRKENKETQIFWSHLKKIMER